MTDDKAGQVQSELSAGGTKRDITNTPTIQSRSQDLVETKMRVRASSNILGGDILREKIDAIDSFEALLDDHQISRALPL